MGNIWDEKCYERVDWNYLKNKESSHYIHYLGDIQDVMKKKKIKRAVKTMVAGAMIGEAGGAVAELLFDLISPFYNIVSAAFGGGGAGVYRYLTDENKKQIEGVYNKVLPIEECGYIGSGEREPWSNSTEKKLGRYAINATGHVIDGLAHGFSLCGAQPKEVKEKKEIDFRKNLYIIGGPIPSAYTRNVLYGKVIKTPYKFRLDLSKKLANLSPPILKGPNIHDKNLEFVRRIYHTTKEPNWYICNEDGNEVGYPKINEDCTLTEDYFMMIKCKNIYPNAKNTKSIIFAGCHGPGTCAAGALIKNIDIIKYIYQEVGDMDFQLIGKVRVNRQSYEGYELETIDEMAKNNIVYIQELKE